VPLTNVLPDSRTGDAPSPRGAASRLSVLHVPSTLVETSKGRRREPLLARPSFRVALDGSTAAVGFLLGYAARYVFRLGGIHEHIIPLHAGTLVALCLTAVAITLFELSRAGLYRRSVGAGIGYVAALRSVSMAMAVVIVASAALQEQNVSRLAYIYGWAAMVLLVVTARLIRSGLLARLYHTGRGVKRVVVVGATPTGKMVMQNVATCLGRGYQLVGFLGEYADVPRRFGRFLCLGSIGDIDDILTGHEVDEVIVALPAASHDRMAEIFTHCQRHAVAVKLVPDLFDLRLSRVHMDGIAGIPVIDVRSDTPDALGAILKRILDVAVAGAALVAAAPLLLLTMGAIRLDSDGPMLFRQERLGKDGKPFTILKFRSMHVDAERQLALLREQNEASGPIFKMRDDPRVTRVGRVIRKLSIDELPQLWNVVRGDMSLVGPRPPLAREVALYEDWHRRRLETTPGITCLWGVSGRSKLDFDEMVMLDLYYIDNWSIGLDLRILARTALMLLRPSGAY